MFCSKCGTELPDDAKFCNICGTRIESLKTENVEELKGKKVTPNIVLGKDGKYHWYYEFKLMKNPTILWLLLKMFFWIMLGIWAFLVIIELFDGRLDWDDFLSLSKGFLGVLCIMEGLVLIGYLVYALMQGWKYCVMFEMDDSGVIHTQMPRQFKKAQAAAMLLIFMGTAAGKPGPVGTGMLAASRNSMASSWDSVKSVEFHRGNDVIKVNERLNKNQVYALKEDYAFVEEFIRSHVGPKCKIYEYKL